MDDFDSNDVKTLRHNFPKKMRSQLGSTKAERVNTNVNDTTSTLGFGTHKMKIGTFCSGVCAVSRLLAPVWDVSESGANVTTKKGFDNWFNQHFVSDCDPDKQEWNKMDPLKQNMSVHGDLCDLLKGRAFCFRENKEVEVPSVQMYVGSSVCKEGSALKQERASLNFDLKAALIHAKSQIQLGKVPDFCAMSMESTAVTTAAAIAYMVMAQLSGNDFKLGILENLYGILRADSPNGELIRKFLHSFGFIAPCIMVQSFDCAVPQRRLRGYLCVMYHGFVNSKNEKVDLAEIERALESSMTTTSDELTVPSGDLAEWYTAVKNEFGTTPNHGRAFRTDCGKKRSKGKVVDEDAGWPAKMEERFNLKKRKFKMPAGDPSPAARERDPYFHSLGKYPQAKVNLQELENPPNKHRGERAYDASHSMEQLLAPAPVLPTLKKTSLIWLEKGRVVLSPQHHWAAQGLYLKDFPQSVDKKKFTDTKLKAFAGDAITGTGLQKVFQICLVHLKLSLNLVGPFQFYEEDFEIKAQSLKKPCTSSLKSSRSGRNK
jgi:hypothetical protein